MKRTKEITIIHYRRRRVRKSRTAATECCPVCGSGSEMITVSAAAKLTGVSRSTLYSWISRHQVHATRPDHGQLHVCRRSLLVRVAQGISEIP